ncbi:hypothetical protein NDU88_002574 [Pleurodeles waltl]|uniref:Uncharacterized protein n=1 Tax=Pleurodeles waltl TaxID=8319 RepID=A0AAV7WNY6_PLEWA|nr:hypothetical protein NDU88_002574 [Pleurodeles waltl]
MENLPEEPEEEGPEEKKVDLVEEDEVEEGGLAVGLELQHPEIVENNLAIGMRSPVRAGTWVSSHNLSPEDLEDRKAERVHTAAGKTSYGPRRRLLAPELTRTVPVAAKSARQHMSGNQGAPNSVEDWDAWEGDWEPHLLKENEIGVRPHASKESS